MSAIFTKPVEMVTQTCSCGGVYAITREFENIARRKGPALPWHCPYCGNQWKFAEAQPYRDKRIENLEAQLQQVKRDRDYYSDRAAKEREAARHKDRQIQGYKGHIAKTKKALRAGNCPCCGKFIKQLYRHMAVKHPEYEFQPEEIPAPDTK